MSKYESSKQMVEVIYQTLHEAIISNIIRSGDRLTEEELSEQFAASRTPVREALKRLEYDEFVVYNVKQGYRVRTFSKADCIAIIEGLEYMGQVATKVAANTISSASLLQLLDNIEKTEKAECDREKYRLLNEFHLIIVDSLNNPFFYNAYLRVYEKFLFISSRFDYIPVKTDIISDHKVIYDMLMQHNEEGAWEAALDHSRKTMIFRMRRFMQDELPKE